MSFAVRFPRLHYIVQIYVFNNIIRINNNNNSIIVRRCITMYYIFILSPYTRPVQFHRRRLHRQMRSGLVWRVLGSPASRLSCRVPLRWLSIAYSIRVRRAHGITIITIVYTRIRCVCSNRGKKSTDCIWNIALTTMALLHNIKPKSVGRFALPITYTRKRHYFADRLRSAAQAEKSSK